MIDLTVVETAVDDGIGAILSMVSLTATEALNIAVELIAFAFVLFAVRWAYRKALREFFGSDSGRFAMQVMRDELS